MFANAMNDKCLARRRIEGEQLQCSGQAASPLATSAAQSSEQKGNASVHSVLHRVGRLPLDVDDVAVVAADVRVEMGLLRHDQSLLYQQLGESDGLLDFQHAAAKGGSFLVMQAKGDRRRRRSPTTDYAHSAAI